MTTCHHIEIDGLNLFYREAGQSSILPQAEWHLLDAGHFALEELHQEIAASITHFFDQPQNPYGR